MDLNTFAGHLLAHAPTVVAIVVMLVRLELRVIRPALEAARTASVHGVATFRACAVKLGVTEAAIAAELEAAEKIVPRIPSSASAASLLAQFTSAAALSAVVVAPAALDSTPADLPGGDAAPRSKSA